MFDNVFGHGRIVSELSDALAQKRLPPAMLLSGPRYNGKLTVALELCRGLSCRNGDAEWNCRCNQCHLHRTLNQTTTVMLGQRYFDQEVAIAGRSLLDNPRTAGAYLLVRAVRKLTRRFDPWLWPETRVQKVAALVAALEEKLQTIEPPTPLPNGTTLRSTVESITQDVGKLTERMPHDLVPIDVIRNLVAWSVTTGEDGPKVVIIEEVHLLQESARNALLKTLEEPPANVYFILTTSRRAAVIPTIQSRLRIYEMPQRGEALDREIQSRIFTVDSEKQSGDLGSLFRASTTSAAGDLEELARMIADPSVAAETVVDRIRRLESILRVRSSAEYLLQLIADAIRSGLAERDATGRTQAEHNGVLVKRVWNRIDGRNMNTLQTFINLTVDIRSM